MIPPRFLKITYNLHSFKQNERIFSPKASSTPLLNSNYDGSFVAGIAQLRYIYWNCKLYWYKKLSHIN